MKTNQFQPVETAPKNGTYILLFGKSGYSTTPLRCSVCRWSHDKERWDDHAGDAFTDSGDSPTHWMPLPKLDDQTISENNLTKLKIGDTIESMRPVFTLHGQPLRIELLTPEDVVYADTLVATGRWRKMGDE